MTKGMTIALAIFGVCVFGMGYCTSCLIWIGRAARLIREAISSTLDQRNAADARNAEALGERARLYVEMVKEQEVIALFLRENYASEISQGFHSGRGLGQIVTGYLARERNWKAQYDFSSQQRSAQAGAVTEQLRQSGE